MRYADQLDAMILLFTTILFYLLFGFLSIVKPSLQMDEYFKLHRSNRLDGNLIPEDNRALFKNLTKVAWNSPSLKNYTFDNEDSPAGAKLVLEVYKVLTCSVSLNNGYLPIWIDVMAACSALMCVHLYAVKGKLPDGVSTGPSGLPWKHYFRIMAPPTILCLAISGSLASFNALWNHCYTGAEQAVGAVIAGFYIIVLFLPKVSACWKCCGCIPNAPPEEVDLTGVTVADAAAPPSGRAGAIVAGEDKKKNKKDKKAKKGDKKKR